MKNAMKAEFRKLLSVRSTYFIALASFLLLTAVTFYAFGFKMESNDKFFLASSALSGASIISFPTAIIAVLLMAHEYRYNTIVYALTLNNSRSKVLAAKFITVFIYSVVLTFAAFGISVGLAAFGASKAGHHIPHQEFDTILLLGKSIFYNSGFALAGLVMTVLIRNITASFAVLFILPGTFEALLGLLIKHNVIYLPFNSLQSVIAAPSTPRGPNTASVTHGAVVFAVYFVVIWIIAFWTFQKRDAS